MPVWNEILDISPIESLQNTLTITCYDQDSFTNDLVGEAKVTVSQAIGEPQWYSLSFQGKMAGEIFIEGTYNPPKQDWNDNASPMLQSTFNPSPMNAEQVATPNVAVNNPMGNLTNEAATAIMSIVNNSRKRGTLTQQGAIDIMKILKSPAAQAKFLGT